MDETWKTDLELKWKNIATLAITDKSFKKKLVKAPLATLNEHGLSLPTGVQARVGGAETEISLYVPPNSSTEIEQIAKWWKRRLDMIRQFGIDDEEQKPMDSIPESTCEDV